MIGVCNTCLFAMKVGTHHSIWRTGNHALYINSAAQLTTKDMHHAMEYRREVDGLRALAVVPVIFFHAGFESFGGGFVGVDVFFVISGYLITKIIASELGQGNFSIVSFYERRARRILPALFLVIISCIPAAWLWLFPSDMEDFSYSLIAVSAFGSNFLFWQETGYFNTISELKPLVHTWSLAVEEQFYMLLPLLMMILWRLGILSIIVSLASIFALSLAISLWATYAKPDAAFYLLPFRAWELLLGALIALHHGKFGQRNFGRATEEAAGWLGIALIGSAIFTYSNTTPFPGHYALIPTVGAALVISFTSQRTTAGRFLGNRIFVGVGLISYSAYLWHQPLLAFARHASKTAPSDVLLLLLIFATFLLAAVSWRYVETPFRNNQRVSRRAMAVTSALGTLFFMALGFAGHITDGFKFRFENIQLPSRWSPPIECHGAVAVSKYKNPIVQCLGDGANGVAGDIFLVGDSHAAQITFPLKVIAQERKRELRFINTESKNDFPYSYIQTTQPAQDRILSHLPNVLDSGDIVVIAFHRGRLNDSRDEHLPLGSPVKETENYRAFVQNMEKTMKTLVGLGVKIILIEDTPLLSNTSTIEKCAYLNIGPISSSSHCSVSFEQDLHTRTLQSNAFKHLRRLYPDSVAIVDPLPTLYRGDNYYNPMNFDGTYRMFDRHHLTEREALSLTDMFRTAVME